MTFIWTFELKLTTSLQEFFSNSLNSFDEDQDVEGALKYLDLRDLQSRFRDLSVTLMPHVGVVLVSLEQGWLIVAASPRC